MVEVPKLNPPRPRPAARFTPQQEASASAISLVSDLHRRLSPKVPSRDPFWETHPPRNEKSQPVCLLPQIEPPQSRSAARFTPQQEASALVTSLVSDIDRRPSPKVPSHDPFWETRPPRNEKPQPVFCLLPQLLRSGRSLRTINPASAPEGPPSPNSSVNFRNKFKQISKLLRGYTRCFQIEPMLPRPMPGSPHGKRTADFKAMAGVPKLILRHPARRPGSPHSKKLRLPPSHLSVISIAAPARRYRLSTRFGKKTNGLSKLTPRRPAPQPGSPHSKKLRLPPSHLSVISSVASARKYPLSTHLGKPHHFQTSNNHHSPHTFVRGFFTRTASRTKIN